MHHLPLQSRQRGLAGIAGDLYIAEAVIGNARFVDHFALSLQRVDIAGVRGAKVRGVQGAIGFERFAMPWAEPKTEGSARMLRIPRVCLEALIRQQAAQAIQREWAGSAWREGGYIVTSRGGTPVQAERVSWSFREVLKAEGLPSVRFHDLRHSAATLLLSLVAPMKLVQETSGHSSMTLTSDTYSHMAPSLRDEIASAMDSIFSLALTKAPIETVQ